MFDFRNLSINIVRQVFTLFKKSIEKKFNSPFYIANKPTVLNAINNSFEKILLNISITILRLNIKQKLLETLKKAKTVELSQEEKDIIFHYISKFNTYNHDHILDNDFSKRLNSIIYNIQKRNSHSKIPLKLSTNIEELNREEDIKKELSLVGLVLIDKTKHCFINCAIYVVGLILYYIITTFFKLPKESIVYYILSGLVILSIVNLKILQYRISKGFYGTNEYETREIIEFMLVNNKDHDNFNGLKSIS